MRLLATIVALSLLAACTQPSPAPAAAAPPKPDLAAEERAIRDADARWLKVAQARDAAGEAALFANDGVAIRAQAGVITGPAAYEAYTSKSFTENPKSQVTWSTDAIRVAESADLAVQYGESQTTGLGPKGDRQERSRFVTVWRKVNGEWKVAYDTSTPVTIAPPPKK